MQTAVHAIIKSKTRDGELLIFSPQQNKTILLDPYTANVYYHILNRQSLPPELAGDADAFEQAVEALKHEGLIEL